MIYKNVTSGFCPMDTLNLLALADEPALCSVFPFLRGAIVHAPSAGTESVFHDVSQAYGRISRR